MPTRSLRVDVPQDSVELRHDQGGQAEGRLVEEHELRTQHERAADGEHLLLAAGERARPLATPLGEAGKVSVDALEHGLDVGLVAARVGAQAKVLLGRQVGEGTAALGDVRDAQTRDVLGGAGGRSARRRRRRSRRACDHAADGAQQRGLASAVGAEHDAHAARRDLEVHAVQHLPSAIARRAAP